MTLDDFKALRGFGNVPDNGSSSCGLCCGDIDDEDKLKWSRFSRIRVTWKLDAAGANGVLSLRKSTTNQLQAFVAGFGENGEAQGYVDGEQEPSIILNEADTDAFKGGALVPRNCAFKAYGISFDVSKMFAVYGSGTDAHETYLTDDQDVFSSAAREILEFELCARVDLLFTRCEYLLGPIGHWTSPGATRGDQNNAKSGLAGLIERTSVAMCWVDRDSNQPSIRFEIPRDIDLVIPGDGGLALFGENYPAGGEEAAAPTFTQQYVEVRTYGYRIGVSNVCAT